MADRHALGLFLTVVAVAGLLSLPATLGYDDESGTGDETRAPSCGFVGCHTLDPGPGALELTLEAPTDIEVGATFSLYVRIDASNIDSDEGNLGLFLLAGPTHELPGDHGWEVVADPNGNPTPYNYNLLYDVSSAGDFMKTWRVRETSGQLGPRNLSVWVNYDNGGGSSVARYVEAQATLNVRANMLADIETQSNGFFHIFEPVTLSAFSRMQEITAYTWDFDDKLDSDGNGDFTDDVEAIGPTASPKYRLDRQVNVTLTVSNATTVAVGQRTLTIRDYGRYIAGPLNGDCLVCHDTPFVIKDLNPYGDAFDAQPEHRTDPTAAMAAIGVLDSDGDSFTNQDELAAGALPGDPASFPTSIQWVLPQATTSVIHHVITFAAEGPDAYSYRWAFGDGRNATGKRVYHAYESEGIYTVTLTYGEARLTRQLKLLNFANFFPAPLQGDCTVCHTSPTGGDSDFNPYGEAFAAQPGALLDPQGAIEAIGARDSDGDGVTNEVEIDAGYFPGDPASVPLPDLKITRIWSEPAAPREGELVVLYAQVVDDGYFDVFNGTAVLYLDGQSVLVLTNLTFRPWVPVLLPLAWEAEGVGTHTFEVRLDTVNQVVEKDEANNHDELQFSVAEAEAREGVPGFDAAVIAVALGLTAAAWRRRP